MFEFLDTIFAFIKQLLTIFSILIAIFIIYMYLNQNNLIYCPEISGIRYPEQNPLPYQNPNQFKLNYKPVTITTKDNVKLAGWLVYKQEFVQMPTLVYFQENAGRYRGYGHSEGTPSEEGLKLDGEAVLRYAFDQSNDIVKLHINPNQIFVLGRSLGGAVAIHVAANLKLPVKGYIIENTFSSMGDLVDILYPIIKPLRKLLLKSKWDSKSIVGNIKYPVLFCKSEKDELIPTQQMETLFNEAKSAKFKDYYVIKNGTHNEGYLHDSEGYKKALKGFIENCLKGTFENKLNDFDKKNQ